MTNILLAVAADCTGTRRCLKGKAATSIHYILDHMEKTYKFDKVRILTDVVLSKKGKTLTAKGLLELLKYYIGKLKPGDNLVFIFAGHGAEGSGCWGTIDGVETLDAVHGIVASNLEMTSSEELTALLEGLDPSCSVTIITEACHSSGLITGLKHQLDGNMSPPYTYEDAPIGIEKSVVHLAGSTRKQISYGRIYNGIKMGKFTRTLCMCLPNTVLECMTTCRRIIPPCTTKGRITQIPQLFCTDNKLGDPCISSLTL